MMNMDHVVLVALGFLLGMLLTCWLSSNLVAVHGKDDKRFVVLDDEMYWLKRVTSFDHDTTPESTSSPDVEN